MKRVGYLVRVYLWTLLVFIVAKVAFMLVCHGEQSLTLTDVWEVVGHGLTLDLSTALYFLIVPYLACVLSIWWQGRVLSSLLRAYFVLISVAFSLAFVADASLYPFWGFKLNASCVGYLATPTEAMASVTTGYLLWRLVVFILVALLIAWGYPAWKNTKHRRKGVTTALYLLLIPAMVIGIRGGTDESTTNVGQVYYSQNQFFNHSAINPVFSFLSSLGHQMDNVEQYQFMTDAACEELLKQVYTTESVGIDTLLTTKRPNVIIILLESCGELFAEAMPRLQRLKQEGIYFSQCYGNSWRTDRGTVCTLSGYPSFPTLSVMKMPEKSRMLPSIARTLRSEGYSTHYLYGGDINFTNMKSYLVSTGWEQLTSKQDYNKEEQGTAQWGVRDDITFKTLSKMVEQADKGPFLIGYSTLSSHSPWDVPTHDWEDEKLNAFAYLDRCLGRFVDEMRQMPQWNDLLIVLTADHSMNYRDLDETQLERNRIPMLWLGGAVKEPKQIDILCNQTDMAATLLAQMGLPHGDFRFSRDVLSETYRYPTAVHNYSNAQLLADSTGYILYDFDAQRLTVSHSPDAQRLLRLDKAILQLTTNDLNER